MIEPLATFPIPMANPPMDMTVRLTLNICMRTKAIRIENGMVRDAIRELLRFHMKKIMTSIMSKAPSRIETSTWPIDFRMRID